MDWPVIVQSTAKQRFILHSREANFLWYGKTQLGFRGTVNPKQVQGSIMKRTRKQSPQDFCKFGDFKTMKLLLSGILLCVFFIITFIYLMDVISFPTKQ